MLGSPGHVGRVGLSSFRGRSDFGDFRTAMPAGSTYTRTGAATGLRLDGTLQTFAANEPQRTDRGLALEPAATNHLRYSQDISNAAWSKTNLTITSDAIAGPDGATTADKVEATASAGTNLFQDVTAAGSASGNAVTFIVKKGSGATDANRFGLRNNSTATNLLFITFNYDTGAISYITGASGASVVAMADGWWRLTLAVAAGVSAGDNLRAYSGFSGSPETAGEFFYHWNASLTPGPDASSPILTTGAAATRGLPDMDWPVPSGRSRILLTFADASELLVEGLTPGGSFDVVTPVLAAGKGRFGVSEMVDWEWRG